MQMNENRNPGPTTHCSVLRRDSVEPISPTERRRHIVPIGPFSRMSTLTNINSFRPCLPLFDFLIDEICDVCDESFKTEVIKGLTLSNDIKVVLNYQLGFQILRILVLNEL